MRQVKARAHLLTLKAQQLPACDSFEAKYNESCYLIGQMRLHDAHSKLVDSLGFLQFATHPLYQF